ncbi:hypothetical protein ACJIZ3_020556 [Penstemon smallii]|uniref:Heptahelical transmembrane protein 1-like n=1 Tax=Penstemon smallii TaxID=265156 RepID=A0ABD3SJP6_9LAMI
MDQEKNQTTSHFLKATDQLCCSNTNINSRRNKGKKYPLLSYHELPDYMKDNEFILNYYRVDWPLKQAFLSLFRWHNETLNVWTHLLGFLLFLGLTVGDMIHVHFITMFTGQFTSSVEANISNNFSPVPTNLIDLKRESRLKMITTSSDASATNWPFYVFLSGSMFCLISSSACHLFCCHSHHLNLQLIKMDYVGISVMIITSFFPPIFYIFQCTPHWQIVYLTGISIIGIVTIITLLSPALSTGKYRPFRAFIFVSMGLFGLLPAVHGVVVNWNDPHRDITLAYESIMALSYLIGTVFYVSRIPERWKPGTFDIAGHSHQIFHLFVVMGALAHYGAAQILRRYRGTMEC